MARFLPIAVIAFLSQAAYTFTAKQFAGAASWRAAGVMWSELFQGAMTVVLIAVVFVPILTLITNMFDRRGSFRVVLTQEYAPLAATMFYVLTATNIATIAIAAFFHYSGIQAAHIASMLQQVDQVRAMLPNSPPWDVVSQQLGDPVAISESLFRTESVAVSDWNGAKRKRSLSHLGSPRTGSFFQHCFRRLYHLADLVDAVFTLIGLTISSVVSFRLASWLLQRLHGPAALQSSL